VTISTPNITRAILAIAGGYALVAVLWFFQTLAKNANQPFRELFPDVAYFVALAVLPYLLFGVATWLARKRWKQLCLLIVAIVSACSTIFLYMGAFTTGQGGEFSVLFMLGGVPQTVVALILIIMAQEPKPKSKA
jgi:cytochrome bd-type quinol oxidase subunit 2